jgi:molybdate transport system permease protein
MSLMKTDLLPIPAIQTHRKHQYRKSGEQVPPAVYGVATLAVCFLVLPMLGLFACISLQGSLAALTSPITSDALLLSFATSTLSTMIVVIFGGALAYVLARKSFKGAVFVDTLVDVPMVLPPMVTGLALLMFLGPHGPLGSVLSSHGVSLVFTTGAVVVAQVFVSLPFFVRAAKAAFESIDPKLERASLLLGASPRRTFFEVVIPTVWPPLAAGAVLAWARCLGEFGATLVFAGNFQGSTQTMPLAIFGALQDNMDVAIALSILLLVTSFLLVVSLKMLTSRYGARNVAG